MGGRGVFGEGEGIRVGGPFGHGGEVILRVGLAALGGCMHMEGMLA
jgi:hypothetical protein